MRALAYLLWLRLRYGLRLKRVGGVVGWLLVTDRQIAQRDVDAIRARLSRL